jgi:hypothetical protein
VSAILNPMKHKIIIEIPPYYIDTLGRPIKCKQKLSLVTSESYVLYGQPWVITYTSWAGHLTNWAKQLQCWQINVLKKCFYFGSKKGQKSGRRKNTKEKTSKGRFRPALFSVFWRRRHPEGNKNAQKVAPEIPWHCFYAMQKQFYVIPVNSTSFVTNWWLIKKNLATKYATWRKNQNALLTDKICYLPTKCAT